ncbi:MAG: hypothetical protein ACLFRO_00760 [Desulfobacterales bacterium]
MFIDRKELDKLVEYKNENKPVVSVYLNVTPPRNYISELNSMIHTTRRSVAERLDKDRLKSAEEVFDRIEK